MRTGLVLEGGAMRGLFTAGVMDVLMENGIEFDGAQDGDGTPNISNEEQIKITADAIANLIFEE